MRIGYCLPYGLLEPKAADTYKKLMAALSTHMQIVLFSPVNVCNAEVPSGIECHLLEELDNDELRSGIDLLVFQFGNDPKLYSEIAKVQRKYSGIAEFNEIGLHDLMRSLTLDEKGQQVYLDWVNYCHGAHGVAIAKAYFDGVGEAPWKEHTLDMCMARPMMQSAMAIIAHSDLVRQTVLGYRPEIPIATIARPAAEIVDDASAWKKRCKRQLGVQSNKVVIGSFGSFTAARRINSILDALEMLKAEKKVKFVCFIVSECEKDLKLQELIQEHGLGDNVCVVGSVQPLEFAAYIGACDFCLELCYPTHGESSENLHHMFGMGKPVIVTDVGTYSDYPDEIALKVQCDENEAKDICDAMRLLATNTWELRRRSNAAINFAREYCDIRVIAKEYEDFFEQIINHTWQPDYEDIVVGRLCELGMTDGDYSRHFSEMVQIMLL